MYEKFVENNILKKDQFNEKHFAFSSNFDSEIKTLFEECGGQTFRNGLYKIHSPDSSMNWADLIGKYFTQFKSRIIPFGFDWLGRQYALDIERKNHLVMFDPSTAENSILNQTLVSFHNHDLVLDRESYLSEDVFNEVIKFLGIEEIKYTDCVGHKVPLFLNGSDSIENFEIINLEVYWEIQCQICLQIKDLPPGTKINSVKFE